MLDSHIAESENLRAWVRLRRQSLSDLTQPSPTTPSTSALSVNTSNQTSATLASSEIGGFAKLEPPILFNTPLPAHQIPNLLEALRRDCILIATDDGYGT